MKGLGFRAKCAAAPAQKKGFRECFFSSFCDCDFCVKEFMTPGVLRVWAASICTAYDGWIWFLGRRVYKRFGVWIVVIRLIVSSRNPG